VGRTPGPKRPEGVRLRGLTVDHQEALAQALRPWIGQALTEGGLDRLTDRIIDHYEENDRPVVDVFVPEQDLSTGTLQIEVTEGRVGTVGLENTQFFNDELLGGSVLLRRGSPLRGSELQEEVDWLNRNPFRSASMFAAPGEELGDVDVLFSLEERCPWRFYLGYDNSGVESVGENRWFAGLNWGNGLGRDHLVNYQFTVGDSRSEFQAHSASWEIPLHRLHHFIRLEGTWADVGATSTSGSVLVDADGTTWIASAMYGVVLPRWRGFSQELTVGADFKTTDNFLTYSGASRAGSEVDLVQFRAEYRATRRTESDLLRLSARLVASPGGLSSNNHDDNFGAFRHDATADYFYGALKAMWLRRIADNWSFRLAAQGQLTGDKLLPIEQLGVGGNASIRGYEELAYLADSGYILSAELRAPSVALPGKILSQTRLQFLGFIDHGIGWLDDGGNEAFTGAGAGLRAELGSHGQLRADLGWPLNGGDGAKAHVGVLVSF
jgi:hemolysin activation/secretion protein